MPAKTLHFRVDNGDLTLICLENGRVILTDINIRGKLCVAYGKANPHPVYRDDDRRCTASNLLPM